MIGPWVNIFKWNFKLTKKFIILFPSGSEPKFEMTGRFVKKPRYFDKNYWPLPEMVHFKIHNELKTEKSLNVCFNCLSNITFFGLRRIFFKGNYVNYCIIFFSIFCLTMDSSPFYQSRRNLSKSLTLHNAICSYAIIWLFLLDKALN